MTALDKEMLGLNSGQSMAFSNRNTMDMQQQAILELSKQV